MTHLEALGDRRGRHGPIAQFRRDHGFLWSASLLLLGLALLAASAELGVAVAHVGRTATGCWHSADISGPITPDTCRAHGGTVTYSGGHTRLGVLLGLLAALTLPWLVPGLIARHYERRTGEPSGWGKRPARPLPLDPTTTTTASPRTWWSTKHGVVLNRGAWWCHYDHHCYWLDASRGAWVRGPRTPPHQAYGNLSHGGHVRQLELLEEQNRLAAGLPPTGLTVPPPAELSAAYPDAADAVRPVPEPARHSAPIEDVERGGGLDEDQLAAAIVERLRRATST